MADEEMERDSPESPSEATPPYGDESPELVDQPSPPEEQRVSSSTDGLPLDISDSSEQERQDFLHYASPTPELAERIRLLLETSRIFFASMQSSSSDDERENQPDEPPHSAIRERLEGPPPGLPCSDEPGPSRIGPLSPGLPCSDEPGSSRIGPLPPGFPCSDESGPSTIGPPPAGLPCSDKLSIIGPVMVSSGLVRAAITVPLLQAALDASQTQLADVQTRYSQEIAKDSEQNIDEEKSDDSNQQFDMEDMSSESKSSPDTVDLGNVSSPSESGVVESEMRSESSATGDAVIENLSIPRIIVTEETSNSEIGPSTNVSLDPESYQSLLGADSTSADATNIGLRDSLSPSKSSGVASLSGTNTNQNFGLRSEISPSKSVTASTDESDSASNNPERRSGIPKRKSPTKLSYPLPKKCAPFPSDDSSQSQNDSLMFSRLEELGIRESENMMGSSGLASGSAQEQIPETDESPNQESDMEVQETADSDDEQKEMTKGDPENKESD